MNESNDAYVSLAITDILDALPFYVLLIDEKHHIIQANRAVRTQLGMQPKDIIGKYCPAVIHGLNEPWYACPLEEAVQKGKAIEREALDRQSGRWIRSAIYPIEKSTKEGHQIFFHMVSDITERKEAEERLGNAHLALKTYAGAMVNSQESERKRIARELHDETIQTLALLCRKLDNMRTSEALPSRVSKELLQAREMGEVAVKGLRDFARALRPPILDDLGLVVSMRRLLLDFSERTGIESQLRLLGKERRLSPDVEIGVFRIAQEALSNIEHHSKATNLTLTMAFTDDQVGIDINDDGVGFNVPTPLTALATSGHLGLLGMQERIELIGGKLGIQSSAGKGTTVSITVPMRSNP